MRAVKWLARLRFSSSSVGVENKVGSARMTAGGTSPMRVATKVVCPELRRSFEVGINLDVLTDTGVLRKAAASVPAGIEVF
jgi:hypothetical protein